VLKLLTSSASKSKREYADMISDVKYIHIKKLFMCRNVIMWCPKMIRHIAEKEKLIEEMKKRYFDDYF